MCKMPDDNHPKLVKPPAYELACAVTTTTPSLAACPTGWTHQGTSCYSSIQTKKNWDDARKMCACKSTTQLGPGDLVSIHSVEENNFVKKLATKDIWLGGRDWFHEGKWEWSDGSENSIFDETGTKKVWTKPTFSADDVKDWLYMTSGIFQYEKSEPE